MKRVLITGASGGIGLDIARLMATKNYQLTLVSRNEEKLKKAVSELPGGGHSFFVADLTEAKDLDRLVSHLSVSKFDILINNAGAGLYGKFINIPLKDQLSIMHLNMDAIVVLSYTFLQKAKVGDSLVNIASLLGHSSFPGSSVYAATKSFVANFSESVWYEFKKKGIYVMSFNPGATKSDFHLHAGKQVSAYPAFVLSSVEDVAKELVTALEKRQKPRVMQGWKNRIMMFMFKFLSRKTAVNMMGQLSPGMK
ncbi:MAG: SDR family NAD(P)-dependent oxidoreductase [Chitinophagaceae bacterium]